jgi:hypothetical protein
MRVASHDVLHVSSRALVALSLLCGTAAHAAPDDPPASEADAKDRSRAAFRKGVGQLRAQDWTGARASFESAYQLFPHPSILLNLGIAHLKTGDPVLAEKDLVRFLSEDGGAGADELATARETLSEARALIGSLRVIVSPPTARISVDGKIVTERMHDPDAREGSVAEVRVKTGRHDVEVDAPGFVTQKRNVDVAGKTEMDVRITLAKNPTAEPSSDVDTRRIVGFGLAGLGGATLITGIVCGFQAKTLADDYADRSKPGSFQNPEVRSDGVTYRTLADVMFGVAVVSGAAAIVLLFTDVGASKSTAVARAFRGPTFTW